MKTNIFFATFIPGLQDFIAQVIKERLSDVKIHKLLDGAVLFETETSYDKLNFFCFNNIFACINIMESGGSQGKSALEKHIRAFVDGDSTLSEAALEIIANNSKKINTFRIVVSSENQPAAIDEKLRVEAEKYISRVCGLKTNRSLPDTEFWFLYRRDDSGGKNFSIFMKRLTIRPSWEKTLHKGELPPPLAWTLCRLANLSHGDTVLDPFCGYGSIPQEALKHFHITNFIAYDNDKKAASFTETRFKKQEKNFTLYKCGFEELPLFLAEKSVDAIVTDPPWGQFKETDAGFLEKMFEIFGKLLIDGGRAVVLYANDEALLKALPACFRLENTVPILLSGKKTAIYQFVKN